SHDGPNRKRQGSAVFRATLQRQSRGRLALPAQALIEHIGLGFKQLPPDCLKVQPADVFAAHMLAAIARTFGRHQAWRNAGGIYHELLLATTLERNKPEGGGFNAVAADGEQAVVLMYGSFHARE